MYVFYIFHVLYTMLVFKVRNVPVKGADFTEAQFPPDQLKRAVFSFYL